MSESEYESRFRSTAASLKLNESDIATCLAYAEKLSNQKLPVIFDTTHFGMLVGESTSNLFAMSNAPTKFYRSFSIKKPSGNGTREIDEPLPSLKQVQNWILNQILYLLPVSKYVKSYLPGSKLISSARFHRSQTTVVRVDIKGFFPSVKTVAVYSLFKNAGYSKTVAGLLTKLCTLNGGLPQGAPTSPYLSNLVLKAVDEALGQYCLPRNIRYTRYCDDLTFSGDLNVRELISLAYRLLWEAGFQAARAKTRVMGPGKRQTVVGLVVNSGIRVRKSYKKEIRQVAHFIDKFGFEEHLRFTGNTRRHAREHLLGRCQYVLSIEPNNKDAQRLVSLLAKSQDTQE